jgi:D-lactate dehydrogenase
MRVAIFSNHKYDQNSFEEANRSFNHDLVFLTATLESAATSLASGFPAVCVFVNDRVDATVLAQLAKSGTKFVALRCEAGRPDPARLVKARASPSVQRGSDRLSPVLG